MPAGFQSNGNHAAYVGSAVRTPASSPPLVKTDQKMSNFKTRAVRLTNPDMPGLALTPFAS